FVVILTLNLFMGFISLSTATLYAQGNQRLIQAKLTIPDSTHLQSLSVDLAFINILSDEAVFPGIPYIDFVYNF
ncbi:MAG: hypothetical protein O7E52_24565, partial [Candidatus Poribacteria bacterium]|nr:hypothetical protein [Candidatus Poribacteria bacterium]